MCLYRGNLKKSSQSSLSSSAMSVKKNHHEILSYLLIGAWILTMVHDSLSCTLWDVSPVQENGRLLCLFFSRHMRLFQRNIKVFCDGMVLSLFFCKQVWIKACKPLSLTRPKTFVLFAVWSGNTSKKWKLIHSHVINEMRWLFKGMVVYFVHPFQGIWSIFKGM